MRNKVDEYDPMQSGIRFQSRRRNVINIYNINILIFLRVHTGAGLDKCLTRLYPDDTSIMHDLLFCCW